MSCYIRRQLCVLSEWRLISQENVSKQQQTLKVGNLNSCHWIKVKRFTKQNCVAETFVRCHVFMFVTQLKNIWSHILICFCHNKVKSAKFNAFVPLWLTKSIILTNVSSLKTTFSLWGRFFVTHSLQFRLRYSYTLLLQHRDYELNDLRGM